MSVPGARRRLLQLSVPAAAVVAVATVLWTVRTPEHDGVVIVALTDVPPLVWAGTDVLCSPRHRMPMKK